MSITVAAKEKTKRLGASQPTVKVAVWKELASLRVVASSMQKAPHSKKTSKRSKASATAARKK